MPLRSFQYGVFGGQRKGPFHVPEGSLMVLTRLIREKPRITMEVPNYHNMETPTEGDPC
jgi:hypothetical protein